MLLRRLCRAWCLSQSPQGGAVLPTVQLPELVRRRRWSQSPQGGAVLPTLRRGKRRERWIPVSIPSRRGSPSDPPTMSSGGSPTRRLNPLKAGQSFRPDPDADWGKHENQSSQSPQGGAVLPTFPAVALWGRAGVSIPSRRGSPSDHSRGSFRPPPRLVSIPSRRGSPSDSTNHSCTTEWDTSQSPQGGAVLPTWGFVESLQRELASQSPQGGAVLPTIGSYPFIRQKALSQSPQGGAVLPTHIKDNPTDFNMESQSPQGGAVLPTRRFKMKNVVIIVSIPSRRGSPSD